MTQRPTRASRSSRTTRRFGARRRRRHSWRWRVGITALSLVLLGLVALVAAYILTPIPKPNDMATAQASVVYFSDGKTELARLSDAQGNRESVKLSDVPLAVQREFLAAEDRTFYTNQGVSPTGILRAVKVALTGGTTQGGSTITQQYVKNYYLTQDQTITRKLKEVMISLKLDRQLTKDQILENYLNTIYFGRGASGIETASQAYFGKNVQQLTVAEGALLASVIRGPSYYDPALGAQEKANAERRWAYVLDGMVTKGWLTPAERAAQVFPTTLAHRTAVSGTNGYLVDLVRRELLDTVHLTDAEIQRGGYRIVTTFDKTRQDAAVKAVNDLLPKSSKLHVGLASIVPGNGAVVALYGGPDFLKEPFNTATQAAIQAGSTFKVFSLIGALQNKMSTSTTFNGYSPQYFPQFRDAQNADPFLAAGGVRNFNNEQFGRIDVRTALAQSVNTVFAQVNILATPQLTAAEANAAGVTTKVGTNYANVFGTDTVRVLDMANAYATVAADGTRATPYFIRKVTSVESSYSYAATPHTRSVFDKGLISDVIDCMTQVIQRGTGSYARILGRPAAGKTGTTSGNYGAWFDGFTPQLATAVGIYRGNGALNNTANSMNAIPGVGQLTGGTVPVEIWTQYMMAALQGLPVVSFPTPAHINGNVIQTPTATTTSTTTTPSSSSSTSPTSAPPPTTSAPRPTTTSAPVVTSSAPPTTTAAPTTTTATATATAAGGQGPPVTPSP